MISTAGDATLTVADPSSTATGHLVNGTFSLPEALQAAGLDVAAPTRGRRLAAPTLKTYAARSPTTRSTVSFKQPVKSSDALRTGTYARR